MADRTSALVITLTDDFRDDEPFLERLETAIRLLKGVATVSRHAHTYDETVQTEVATARAKEALRKSVAAALNAI